MSQRFALVVVAGFLAIVVSGEIALSLPVAGVGPDLLVLVVCAFSVGERPRAAAVTGFTAGVVRDLLLATPRGIGGLAYAAAAYGVAAAGVSRSVWGLLGALTAATFASQVLFGVGVSMFDPAVSLGDVPRVAFVVTAYNALISPLLLPLLRRMARSEAAESSLI